MSTIVNCVSTRDCPHKKSMGTTRCAVLGCSQMGTDRSHVHVNYATTTSLVMLCHRHNMSNSELAIKKNTGIVDLPRCTCCSCGCNDSSRERTSASPTSACVFL